MIDITNIRDYKKIILLGSGGSGKSYMSKHIAQITGYPLYHLDNEFWKQDWVMSTKEEKLKRHEEIFSEETWIIDGNYNSTMEIRFAAADLIIFLDINRIVCILSAARRAGKKRSDLPDYLTEHKWFNKEFLQFAKWQWDYPKTDKPKVVALREKYHEKAFLHIKNRREVKEFIKKWGHNDA